MEPGFHRTFISALGNRNYNLSANAFSYVCLRMYVWLINVMFSFPCCAR